MTNTPKIWHNARIRIDDETSAPIDISGNANLCELTEGFQTGTYQAFGDSWDYSNDGGRNWKLKLKIYFSVAAAEAYIDILESWKSTLGVRTCELDVPNSSPGSRSYIGDGRLSGDITLSVDRTSNEVGTVEFEVIGHGALTPATIV